MHILYLGVFQIVHNSGYQVYQVYTTFFAFRSFLLKNLHRIDKDKLGFKIDLDIILNNLNEVEKSLPNKLFYGGEVLFVKGEKSNYINDSNINTLINQFPKYKIVEIQNAGHWVHAENLNDFIKETLLFLES